MFDLVIVGAGIVGLMAAYLAKQSQPAWSTLLLDRSMAGDGATKYSVALDVPFGRRDQQKRLARSSTQFYRELRAAIPELPIHEIALFGLVAQERVGEVVASFAHDEIRPASAAEREQLYDSYADLLITEDTTLLNCARGSYSFPQEVVPVLLNRLKESGTECWEGVEILDVERREEGLTLLTSDGREIQARRVIITTGPWLLKGPGAKMAASAGIRIKKVAALQINSEPKAHAPALYFFDEDAFLLPLPSRRELVFSFTSQEWDCQPEISALKISPEDRAIALSILKRYNPALAAKCHGGRVFCDAYSPDRMPLIGQVPEMPGCVLAGACSGAGYRLAPAIAWEALKLFF